MSHWNLEPIPPPRNRSRSLLVGVLLILAAFIVIGALFMLERGMPAFAPTPTPTATNAPPKSSTPDFRATHVVEDMITQQANPIVIDLGTTPPAQAVAQLPVPDSTAPLTPTVEAPSEQQELQPIPVEGPQGTVTVSLSLPYVPGRSTPVSIIPTPTPTNPPYPTATPTPPPATATVTQVPPTPSPTTTPIPLPTSYVVDRLLANIEKTGVKRQRGPSSHYENDGEFVSGEIWLEGRSSSGEWVYASQDSNMGWLRQADARPRDNELPDNAPEGANPNDVRWLAVQSAPSDLGSTPVPTAIPINDFPLEYRNRSNQNWVNRIPLPAYNTFWTEGGYDAGQPFSSPVVVAGNSVIAANEDGHIYAIDRQGGNQKWRQVIENRINRSPAIQNSDVFAIDDLGIVHAVRESGTQWSRATEMTPSAGVNIGGEWAYVVARGGDISRLHWIRLDNGDLQQTFDAGGREFYLPAIGDQMIYVVGNIVRALELSVIEIEDEPNRARQIWEYTNFNGASPSTAPVYVSPGVRSLAELFVGATNGEIYLLDANTGAFLDWYEGDQIVRYLAIDGSRLYAASDNRLATYSRESRELLWTADLTANVVSGPISDGESVIVFLTDGSVEVFDVQDGTELGDNYIPRDLRGGAVSNPYLFSTSSDNKMYGLEGQNR